MVDHQKLDRSGLLNLLVVYFVWGSTYLAIGPAFIIIEVRLKKFDNLLPDLSDDDNN